MSNIMFFFVHQVGSLNTSLQLAADLKSRGHKVVYAGLADSAELIKNNGFEFYTLFERFFPRHAFKNLDYYEFSKLSWLNFLVSARRRHALLVRFVDYLIAGGDEEFLRLMKDLHINFIVLGGVPHVEWLALMARSLGIGAIYLRSAFSVPEGTGSPPASSGLVPKCEGSILQSLRVLIAWKRHNLAHGWNTKKIAALTKRIADKYGVDDYRMDCPYKKEFSVSLPELIPFHPDFEFDRIDVPDRHYIGASVWLERKEVDFPWESIADDRPLIYCALGTYLWQARSDYVRFFRQLSTVAKEMPGWRWVVVNAGAIETADVDSTPENVICVNEAPQLALLKRAKVMITHGGANTVKECILFGVPMVIFPMAGDHHGVAARAVYHGLATRGNFKHIESDELKSKIVTAATNPYI
ncbi:hypothetical protein A1351_22435, partial [Methylosinus sp. R-45379]|uniref:nucleotide disphospho-sugar-binding domain-containing protein n=1 Tax=Methylosinus sp. R-45379 TaxID=980563 RepID=UPI0007D860B5